MTKDLDETLNELGPEYRAVVARLLECEADGRQPRYSRLATRDGRLPGWSYLRAAALALVLFLPCLFFNVPVSRRLGEGESNLSAPRPHEYVLASAPTPAAVAELVRTQRPDGSWANDFLTRRNALALKDQSGAEARLAYRKAVRNLRLRGML